MMLPMMMQHQLLRHRTMTSAMHVARPPRSVRCDAVHRSSSSRPHGNSQPPTSSQPPSSSSSSRQHRLRGPPATTSTRTSSLARPRALPGRGEPQPQPKQPASSSRQQQQQQETSSSSSSPYAWGRQRLPGDSGWDLLKLRSRDAKTFNRFREVEVIHARWAMLGVMSLLLSDVAGSPFPPKEMTAVALAPWGGVGLLSLALIETYRLAALWDEEDFDKRAYPGKRFDPLGFTKPKAAPASSPSSPEQLPGLGVFAPWLGGLAGWLAGGWWFEQREMTQVELLKMKDRELRNGRLAMVSFIGCFLASALTGRGPITLLLQHISDPMHSNVLQTLQ